MEKQALKRRSRRKKPYHWSRDHCLLGTVSGVVHTWVDSILWETDNTDNPMGDIKSACPRPSSCLSAELCWCWGTGVRQEHNTRCRSCLNTPWVGLGQEKRKSGYSVEEKHRSHSFVGGVSGHWWCVWQPSVRQWPMLCFPERGRYSSICNRLLWGRFSSTLPRFLWKAPRLLAGEMW